ncbi:MAG: AEC family transporter [Acholeplasmataceae bacterium]
MESLVFAANAVLPIILLILLGYILKRIEFFDQPFFNQLNAYIFRIGLPVLLFHTIYEIESFESVYGDVLLFVAIAFVAFFFLGWIFVAFFVRDRAQKGVVLQSFVRGNFALIGLPLAQLLGGMETVRIYAVLLALVVLLTNVLSVFSLTYYKQRDEDQGIGIARLFKSTLFNPLILAVLFAFLILFIRSLLPSEDGRIVFSIERDLSFFYHALELIGRTVSPLALIALGGQFRFSAVARLYRPLLSGVIGRIVVVPGVALLSAYYLRDALFGIDAAFPSLIAVFGAPVAVSSTVLTYEIGGDDELAGQLVFWSTLFSMPTIFLAIVIFRSLGVL